MKTARELVNVVVATVGLIHQASQVLTVVNIILNIHQLVIMHIVLMVQISVIIVKLGGVLAHAILVWRLII